MEKMLVNINFKKMAIAFRTHVRFKAMQAGSSIVYMEDGRLVEENPRTLIREIIALPMQ
jgi:hypothetical protein